MLAAGAAVGRVITLLLALNKRQSANFKNARNERRRQLPI